MSAQHLPRRSLTRRLLVTVLLLEVISAATLIAAATVYEWRVHLRAFDVMLHGRADTLLGAVGDAEDPGDNVILDMSGMKLPSRDVYRVEDEKGRVLGESHVALPLDVLSRTLNSSKPVTAEISGRDYRVIRITGVRVVDPGDANGGVRHQITAVYGSPTGHIQHAVFEAVRFYSSASLGLLLLTCLALVWLLRRDLAPLHELAHEAERISASNWSFHTPPAAKETSELAPLAHAIESALARLQVSFEQQRRFTSDAAHELKTDVAIAKSSLQLLTMRSRTAEQYRRGLELCLDDCTRLERTVQQMLTLARVEQGEPHSRFAAASCSLRDCLRKSVRQTATFAELRDIRVELSTQADPFVGVDERDCILLCSNVLLNAIEHSPKGSVVRVALGEEAGEAIVNIEDEGEGIAAEDLPHIFEPFYRCDPSRARKSGGTGLGLAICRAICESAGGSIVLENMRGAGAKAAIRLPKQIATPESASSAFLHQGL